MAVQLAGAGAGACILMTAAHLPRAGCSPRLLRSPPAVRCRAANKLSRSFTVPRVGGLVSGLVSKDP